ncbi:hypothetical protein B0H19DRAFT_1231792 [Mycena capillaripes]|nr:hypothetical protein B0H19DRAFT_1231792 [Mycena capillaripes]
MSDQRVSGPSLPAELWMFIHRMALSDISPLAKVYSEDEIMQYNTTADLPLKHRELQRFLEAARLLRCVCRLWSKVAQEVLFENLWVNNKMRWPSLSLALEQPDIARLVRSVRLSPTRLDYNVLVLRRCAPHIRVLVLPEFPDGECLYAAPESEISLAPLRSLKRLYWVETFWSAPLLHAVLSAAPNLEHVSLDSTTIGSDYEFDELNFAPLPYLRFLALFNLSTQCVYALLRTDMPQLAHLTISTAHVASDAFPLLPTLHTLILAGEASTPFPAILRHCPALRELRYNALCRPKPPEATQTAAKLLCVRLYLSPPVFVLIEKVERNAAAVLIRPAFPALERVVLDGSAWGAFEERRQWAQLQARGCRVEAGIDFGD